MHFRKRTLVTLCMGAMAATTAFTMSPVSAQSTSGNTGNDLVTGSSQLTTSANLSTAGVLSSMDILGSSDFVVPSENMSGDDSYPLPIDESIVIPEIRNRVAEPEERLERWTIASPAMSREVDVQILLPSEETSDPAPMVYLLDGIEAPRRSGWVVVADVDEMFADENVTLVMPTQGNASLYMDWYNDDPALGRMQWETFLTEELPPLLDSGLRGVAGPLAHNGSWGVMGLSMGASAALHLANTYDMFDAVAGVSGAYSTLDELGYQYARLTVDARHGDVTNMWGPRGSGHWAAHDTIADPTGLADKSVYLSAATGLVGSSELGRFGSNEMVLLDGHVLEKGSYESTRQLESALVTVPGVDLTTNYMPTGIHNWPVFVSQMRPGMENILAGLPQAQPNGEVSTRGLAEAGAAGGSGGSAGSSGSVGSSGSPGSTGSSGSAGSVRAIGGSATGSAGS